MLPKQFSLSTSSSRVLFAALALLFGAQAAFAVVPLKTKLTLIKETKTLTDANNKKFMCANVGTKKKANWQAGKKTNGFFVADAPTVELLKKMKKLRKPMTVKQKKQLQTLLDHQAQCKGGITGGGAAIAHDTTATGVGMEPVAVDLLLTPGTSGLKVDCKALTQPANGSVEIFPNCKALVKPASHRSGAVSFQFAGTQEGDTRVSNTATATVTWDQAAAFNGEYHSLAQYKDSLTEQEAMHIIRWEGLGANRDKLVALATGPDGLQKLVDALVTPTENCAAAEAKAMQAADQWNHIAYQYRDGNGNVTWDNRRWIWNPVLQQGVLYADTETRAMFNVIQSVQAYWVTMLRSGCQPMRERMAMLFHNHFAVDVSPNGGQASWRDHFMMRYLNYVRGRQESAGTNMFPDLERMVSLLHDDPAMMAYLDNRYNTWTGPTNENYARELMELFTMGQSDAITGARNFEERDVYEMSYALTGHTEVAVTDSRNHPGKFCCNVGEYGCTADIRCIDLQEVSSKFDDNRWNDTRRPRPEFLFEGQPWEAYEAFKSDSTTPGQDTLTKYLFDKHPGVARFLAARLTASIADVTPTDQQVTEVASQLKADNFQMTPTLKKLMTSSAYFSQAARYDCVSAPMETAISFANIFNLPTGTDWFFMNSYLNYTVAPSGQNLLMPPSVFGWQECGKITGDKIHTGTFWLNAPGWLANLNGMALYMNTINYLRGTGAFAFDWKSLLPPAPQARRDPAAIIDYIAGRIGTTLTDNEKALLKEYLTKISTRSITDPNTNVIVPDPAGKLTLDISKFSDADLDQWWTLKGPGLLQLFYGLKINHVK